VATMGEAGRVGPGPGAGPATAPVRFVPG
jgi:hypothetical protein